jgi:hypothetical protein
MLEIAQLAESLDSSVICSETGNNASIAASLR